MAWKQNGQKSPTHFGRGKAGAKAKGTEDRTTRGDAEIKSGEFSGTIKTTMTGKRKVTRIETD